MFNSCSSNPLLKGNERKRHKASPSPHTRDNTHAFEDTYFKLPTYCDHCGELLWGIFSRQGLQCLECNYVCHFDCEPHLTKCCRGSSHSEYSMDHEFTELPTILSKSTYCNVCRRMILSILDRKGLICKVCQYVVHYDCMTRAENNCVRTSDVDDEIMRHHWVEGNIHEGKCLHCEEEMSIGSGMTGFRCYWCSEVVHNKCKKKESVCNMGPLGSLKLPPIAITTNQLEPTIPFRIIPERLKSKSSWPLLVFINRRSGGQQGRVAREALLRVLNPLQIFDLSDGGPDVGLNTFLPLAEAGIDFVILACGGDGTISWVLNALHKKRLPKDKTPPVGILPLGTGNDLARVLGWGEGYEEEDITPLLYSLFSATPVFLDRWRVSVKPHQERHKNDVNDNDLETVDSEGNKQRKTKYNHHVGWEHRNGKLKSEKKKKMKIIELDEEEEFNDGEGEEEEEGRDVEASSSSLSSSWEKEGKIFNNYFSLGIDANVALRFHSARQADPKKFSSRNLNKFHYFAYGASQMLQDPPLALQDHVQLEIDGVDIPLPSSLEGIVLLNLPSYAGGADPWGNSQPPFRSPSIGDKLLEVGGITSSLHLGQITAQTSTAVQIGQGRHIRISLDCITPCQADGEPWLQKPGVLEFSYHSRAKMLLRKQEINPLIRSLDPSFILFSHWET